MKDLLNTFLNKEVVAIDAKGINHKGKLVGVSSVNANHALIMIDKNKIMEIAVNRIKGA
jgi:hypothetical protein